MTRIKTMWQVALYNEHQHDQFVAAASFVLAKGPADVAWRLVDALPRSPGTATIRMHIRGDSLVVDCRDLEAGVELACGSAFSCDVPVELPLPAIFQLGDSWIEVRAAAALDSLGLESLHGNRKAPAIRRDEKQRGPDADTVAKWLSAASELHRMAASSPDFFDSAAQIALDCTGLDAALVVRHVDNQWTIAGSAILQPEHGISFEYAAVELVTSQPDAWRRIPNVGRDKSTSHGVSDSIIVAPVRDEAGQVVAALYGVRHGRGDNRRSGIRALEARVIETIADAVSVGMARREHELQSARQRVLIEQAFSPAMAERLLRHPEALCEQVREATLLFADLQGFTRLSECLPPAEACALVADVLEMLTRAIMDHGGMVVDYYGDGVCAMWNAPFDMADHADRACAAAMQMFQSLPEVSRRRQRLLIDPLRLGIGLHAGSVHVGNAGTRRRPKYGPRGRAVNLASRVQSAAKRLDVSLLATDAVRKRLSSRFVSLKVCTARLPGVDEPIELFTLFPAGDAQPLQSNLEQYAVALEAFERGDLDAAEKLLMDLLAAGPTTPAAFLAQQTAALRKGGLGRREHD
ncbi:MAG TPA: adenylate/guanylate cyclase domain-containing protein, partial [Lacipirellula sp.]